MPGVPYSVKGTPIETRLAFVQRTTEMLRADERIRAAWLMGSLAAGSADPWSDVDLRIAVGAEDYATIGDWWPSLIEQITPTVWKRRWPSPPDQAIISAISTEYLRFDVVAQSAADTSPHSFEAAQSLFDKDGLATTINLTAPARHDPLARLSFTVEEFIRLVGMLPIVVGRGDVPMGMEGQMGLHSMLIGLLLLENGIDRLATGKRHVVAFLTNEQRAILASVPTLAPTMESVIHGRVEYARRFFPRARRLMEANGLTYPEAFEAATRRYLEESLSLVI